MRIQIETIASSVPPVSCEYATCNDEADLKYTADSETFVMCKYHVRLTMEEAFDNAED